MPTDLTPVIAASARWLLAAYPPPTGALNAALAAAQARQAAELAAQLRYPTAVDVELLHLLGPGGSDGLDLLTGHDSGAEDSAWRTWVDETVVSWAACLLADPALAARAHQQSAGRSDTRPDGLRRLTHPGAHESEAAVLLRHPDLLESVAARHRSALAELLGTATAPA
ncbi:hypothetical protein [Streptomyces sp. TLI_171]|uniref:hypothetical protein n=1 Tax=Streptomyces sp. TLI_171 TaxID=1938859 RepID=UPI000C19AA79|nr:hypothetical protein [Streptomyces sp. TLI_171]RKE23487.1 hypothetical protein BX266_6959 [Streptomyces sp. TLI_171]